jgi:hypothetical protein
LIDEKLTYDVFKMHGSFQEQLDKGLEERKTTKSKLK